EVAAARTAAAVPELMPSKPNLAAGSAPNPFEDEAPTKTSIAKTIASIEFPASAEPVMLPDADLVVDLGESFEEPTRTAIPRTLAAMPEQMLERLDGTRLFIGPVRSGVILDHEGHLIVFGDVNPGAEVRATGNIVVLGRLRGT